MGSDVQKNSMCVGRLPTDQSAGLAPQAAVAFAVAARWPVGAAAAAAMAVVCAAHHVPARLPDGCGHLT